MATLRILWTAEPRPTTLAKVSINPRALQCTTLQYNTIFQERCLRHGMRMGRARPKSGDVQRGILVPRKVYLRLFLKAIGNLSIHRCSRLRENFFSCSN